MSYNETYHNLDNKCPRYKVGKYNIENKKDIKR